MLINFFLSANWVVKLDILILLLGSVIVWAIIFERCIYFSRARKLTIRPHSQQMEKYLVWLATIGSVSPYVGLFGTVCGIISALLALSGNAVQISTLMPGIGEALITTALGLVTAIPAIIAYNHLVIWKDRLCDET